MGVGEQFDIVMRIDAERGDSGELFKAQVGMCCWKIVKRLLEEDGIVVERLGGAFLEGEFLNTELVVRICRRMIESTPLSFRPIYQIYVGNKPKLTLEEDE